MKLFIFLPIALLLISCWIVAEETASILGDSKFKSGETQFTIDSKFDNAEEMHLLELGEVLCNSTQEISVKLKNISRQDLHFPRRTFSCGCIGALPENFEIKADQQAELRFELKVKSKSEVIYQNIAFWNDSDQPTLQLQLKLTSVTPIKLPQKSIIVKSDKQQKIVIPVVASSASVDLNLLEVTGYNAEIISTRLIAKSSQIGELQIEIDPKQNTSKASSSTLTLEVRDKAGLPSSFETTLEYPNRTVIAPQTVRFDRSDKISQANIIVRSSELERLLKNDAAKLEVVLEDKNTHKIHCLVVVSKPAIAGMSRTVKIEVDTQLFESVLPTAKLRCGTWEAEFQTLQ